MAHSQKKSHEPQVREPQSSVFKGLSEHLGTLVVAGLGCLFVSYVFNFQDVKTTIDASLGGLDHSTKSHESEVSRYFVLVFPYLAGALALSFLRILGGALLNNLSGLFRSKQKSKAKKEAPVDAIAAQPAVVRQSATTPIVALHAAASTEQASVKPAKAPAVWVKPPKPSRPERGVVTTAPAKA